MTAALLHAGAARAADITVLSSGAFYSAIEALAPAFEKASGHKVILVSGSSMGSSPTAIPARLKRGEPADVLMMAGTELDRMIAEGLARPGSRVDLVHSKIGMSVKAGAPKPDIGTQAGFEAALMAAKSIGYSASASGTYLAAEGFAKLGEPRYAQVMAKAREVVKDRVATWVARGDLDIGFQQVSELLPVEGADFVGPIPAPYQRVTIFSAGVAANAKEPQAAQALIAFLTSPPAFPIIRAQGLEPASEATVLHGSNSERNFPYPSNLSGDAGVIRASE
jgi:molybdate transport system substrate-binding protein